MFDDIECRVLEREIAHENKDYFKIEVPRLTSMLETIRELHRTVERLQANAPDNAD